MPFLLALLLATFPWGFLARDAGGILSSLSGRHVSIGSGRRIDWISFTPTIELRDVRVAQPAWAGPGELARMDALRLRLPVLPLLIGRVRPSRIEASGLTLSLVRDAFGRESWSKEERNHDRRGGPALTDLTIRNGRIRLDDAGRHIKLTGSISSDREDGLRVDAAGTLRGAPLRLRVRAPAIAGLTAATAYRARIAVRSSLVSFDAIVRMDRPLDTRHFLARIEAGGADAQYLDDILQIGLFRTQAFHLSADVRRDGQAWRVPRLDATVRRSILRASLAVSRGAGRTRLNGRIDAKTLDFDDLASEEQQAHAAARERRIGPRLVPAIRIKLGKLDTLDGRLVVRAERLLSRAPSPFRSLTATLVLDKRKLVIAPLMVGLPRGRITGTASIDGRGRMPRLNLNLRMAGASVGDLLPEQQVVAGPLRAHLRLEGSGVTVRDALAHSHGKAAFVVANGNMRRDYATFLGGDLFKSIGAAAAGKSARTNLDCLIATFATSNGRMVPQPLLLSTPIARGDGTGSIMLGPEAIDLRLSGKPTRPGPLLSTAPVRIFGTLSAPRIDIRPPRAKSQTESSVLARIGFFINKLRARDDAQAPAAARVNCEVEIQRALE